MNHTKSGPQVFGNCAIDSFAAFRPGEKRVFKIVLSAEEFHQLDPSIYPTAFVARVQRLAGKHGHGQSVDWVAVLHKNTANPHYHFLIRGLDRRVLRFASQLFSGVEPPLVAGPLVWWTDWRVYAIIEIGGVGLPANSTPALLLEALGNQGFSVVRLSEYTVTGGYTRPYIRKGGEHASQWLTVWLDGAKCQRKFYDPERNLCETAGLIVQHAMSVMKEQGE